LKRRGKLSRRFYLHTAWLNFAEGAFPGYDWRKLPLIPQIYLRLLAVDLACCKCFNPDDADNADQFLIKAICPICVIPHMNFIYTGDIPRSRGIESAGAYASQLLEIH
jgi:hypothetical protein